MRKSTLSRIRLLNEICFPLDDSATYSNMDYLLEVEDLEYIIVRDEGAVVGYLIYRELETHLEGVRRGVLKEHRGKGLGLKLSKMFTRIANKRNKDIYTYVATYNMASLNSNLSVGYRVTAIHNGWVYIQYIAKR